MTADLKRPTFSDFRDSSRYVKVPDRNVFSEGNINFLDKAYDENGNPIIDPETGKQKLQPMEWKIDKDVLQLIASINNARNDAGDFSPISLGHNDLRNPSEQATPPLVGVGGDYKVAWDEPHKCWMLRANYYIRKEDFEEAKKYPYTSIELHPADGAIHPISLIRRAPKKDLGAWIFARDGQSCSQAFSRFDAKLGRHVTVLQYVRDIPDTEMNLMVDETKPDAAASTPPEMDVHEKTHHYLKDTMPYLHHITQHPYHADMVKQYAMDMPGDNDADDQPPVGEPNATPAEDAERNQPPIQNAAFPSATNTFMPGKKKDDEPMQHARTSEPTPTAPAATATPASPAAAAKPAAATPAKAPAIPAPAAQPSQFARDVQAQQYSRLADMVGELTKTVQALSDRIETKDRESAQSLHFARCEAAVQDLIHKHNRIVEDPDGVLARLKAVAPDKLQEEVLFFAKNLPHDIAGLSRDMPLIRTPVSPANGFTAPEPDEDPETGELSPRRASQVLAYQRDHNMWGDEAFEKAKKECPKNYRLAAPPQGNSPRRN